MVCSAILDYLWHSGIRCAYICLLVYPYCRAGIYIVAGNIVAAVVLDSCDCPVLCQMIMTFDVPPFPGKGRQLV